MTNWVQTATVATPIAVAVLGLAGVVWGKRLARRTDDAVATKTEAEAHQTEINTARSLLEDVRAMYVQQKTEARQDKAELSAELSGVKAELRAVEKSQAETDHKLMVLLAELAAHRPWDSAAFTALTARDPNYPPPPPINATLADWPKRP